MKNGSKNKSVAFIALFSVDFLVKSNQIVNIQWRSSTCVVDTVAWCFGRRWQWASRHVGMRPCWLKSCPLLSKIQVLTVSLTKNIISLLFTVMEKRESEKVYSTTTALWRHSKSFKRRFGVCCASFLVMWKRFYWIHIELKGYWTLWPF